MEIKKKHTLMMPNLYDANETGFFGRLCLEQL